MGEGLDDGNNGNNGGGNRNQGNNRNNGNLSQYTDDLNNNNNISVIDDGRTAYTADNTKSHQFMGPKKADIPHFKNYKAIKDDANKDRNKNNKNNPLTS